jgi:hypothetical protein
LRILRPSTTRVPRTGGTMSSDHSASRHEMKNTQKRQAMILSTLLTRVLVPAASAMRRNSRSFVSRETRWPVRRLW